MVQSPGLLVSDTKFDLAVAPAGFLTRSIHLWDPLGAFGQLQNQAYGYLWPMGPFFLLGSVLDVPGWVIQRSWMALVMCVALTGAVQVARALGVRSDLACLVGGFAYALSPRMLTTLGPISIEAWPSALAPWVLLPLVVGSTRGSARRAAALSALAVAMVGGVNAAAAFAVLPLGVLWLLTRTSGPRRRTMMLWWPAFTALATLWWLVPLVIMGVYSPPFLDYIESASNTTFPTTLFDALRGTSDWVPYVDANSRAGNDLIRQFFLPLDSGVVLLLGLVGLLKRNNPHRLFLTMGVVVGLCMVTMGHLGSVHGWVAADLNSLLDGVLAPLRNVHKFDPILRLPLVLGLAWLVDACLDQVRDDRGPSGRQREPLAGALRRVNQYVVVGTAVIAVAGAALPAVAGRTTPGGAFPAIPGYWTQAAAWLGHQPGTALLVPGSSFGTYVWGSPRDEPFQSLATTPWAVRNAVPLVPPGNIRMLDAIEARLAQGRGSPGLAQYLRRAGVTHLVVRNDLARSPDVPDPVLVHQAIEGSPGLERVETFGPNVGGEAHLEEGDEGRILVNGGWQNDYPAIEIYDVAGDDGFAVSSELVPIVVGGPEDLLDLSDLDVIGDEPTQLASDVTEAIDPSAPVVLTDGLRAVERNFGRVHDGASATLIPGDARRLGNPTRDYLLPDADRWSTTGRIAGANAVLASSSMSDANAFGTVQPGQLPTAAADGDDETAWTSNYQTDESAWWQVDFDASRPVDTVTVTAGPDQPEVLRVRTANGTSQPVTLAPGRSRSLTLQDRGTGWLRVEDASGRVGNQFTLAEVSVPGLTIRRSLALPALPEEWGNPTDIVLRSVSDARTGCADVDGALRCVAGRDVTSEEPSGFRRSFALQQEGDFDAELQVRARPGDALYARLLQTQPIGVSGSSQGNPDSRASVLGAVDGDPGTTWTATSSDLRPVLRMNWIGMRKVTGLNLSVAEDTAARLPSELTLIWPEGRRDVSIDAAGHASFPTIRTDQLTLRVEEAEPATSLDFSSAASPVPVGISELRVKGVPFLPIAISNRPVRFACGSGPTLSVNDDDIETSVTASPADLYSGTAVSAELCGSTDVGLTAGANDLDLVESDLFVPTSLVLSDGTALDSRPGAIASIHSDAVHRVLMPEGTRSLVAVRENTNSGWRATQTGQDLAPVVVDGWQQGWRPHEDDKQITVVFGPDRLYRSGLFGGLSILGLLVLIVCVKRRWTDTAGDPLGPRAISKVARIGIAVLAGGLLAGWPGALLGAAGCAMATFLTRRTPESAPWLLAGVLLPAAIAYSVRPWGDASGWAGDLAWPHYLVVLACGALFGWSAGEPSSAPRPRLRRRIPGFSTNT